MGQQLISLKGGNASWRGKTTLGICDRGERRFLQMENCYVSPDGSEIRHFPGFATILDLSEENNDSGYARFIHDAVLPIVAGGAVSPNEPYYQYLGDDSSLLTLEARAKPVHYHCFEQIRDTLLIVGESRFREVPLMASDRTRVYIVDRVAAISVGGYVHWAITMNGTPAAFSATNATGAGLNGIRVSPSVDIVYVEGVVSSDPTEQALIDASLNGRIHEVKAVVGSVLTLHTQAGGAFSIHTMLAGTLMKVRDNRSDVYSSPAGVDAYTSTIIDRTDDPDALTSWRVVDRLSFENPYLPCYPSWVANRQRDFGDSATTDDTEGVFTRGIVHGASRREQRKLPFRVNPEPASDRLILAAPQYNCLFHVPLVVPFNPQDWPSSPDNQSIAGTFFWPANNIHDKPRALGIPKARLVECSTTPAPTSPSGDGNFSLMAVAGSPDVGLGLDPGEYSFAIAYEDDATGEEGLASEPIFVTIPSNNFTYTIVVNYIHPGYIMPECLATSINVYLATPGTDALAYYCSFPLSANTGSAGTFTLDAITAVYGRAPISPDLVRALISSRDMPLLGDGGQIEDQLDPERLAPLSASMPRGGESARFVRGVLFTIGHLGETGGSLDLWESRASTIFGSSDFPSNDEIQVRAHGATAAVDDTSVDGGLNSGGFGIGGRCFPDAYEGITFYSKDLLSGPEYRGQIDTVRNRKADSLVTSQYTSAHYERLRLTHPIYNRNRAAGLSPPASQLISRTNKRIWYQMPKGQLQIGDPGAPSRASKAAIQFIDPNKGDDGVAMGQIAGTVIMCSRKETYAFAWSRNPGGEIPNLVSNEYGCIGANTMVEFDGGLAWLSERGPVAMGQTLQFVGQDVTEDFYGSSRKYVTDSRGMMRHAWACHDAQRGLVMWGVITAEIGAVVPSIEIDGDDTTFVNADDKGKSRFPCDEVLVWSYRSGAFTTWRPPLGLEVYWMRPLRDSDGEVRICFLAADGRVYGFDDIAADSNYLGFDAYPVNVGESSTTLVVTNVGATSDPIFGQDAEGDSGRALATLRHLRTGMLVEFFNEDDELVAETTVASAVSATNTITLAAACTWKKKGEGWKVRIGGRQRMTLVTTYIGDMVGDNMHVDGVQARYTLHGGGLANAKVTLETGTRSTSEEPLSIALTDEDKWPKLGGDHDAQGSFMPRFGRRVKWNQGGAEAPEVSLKVVISGASQVRFTDLSLEVT